MRTRKTIEITRTNLPAGRAHLASHVRADKKNFLSLSFSLIFDELLKLEETPTVQPSVQSLAHIFIPGLSYSFKVLQNDCISRSNNLPADIVVDPSHVAFLPARDTSQFSLSRLCAFSLKFTPQILVLPDFGFVASENLAIGCDSKVIYSDINTDSRTTNMADVDVFKECNMCKKPALPVKKDICGLVRPSNVFPIIIRNLDGDINPLIIGGESQMVREEAECPFVVSDRHRLESDLLFAGFISFESFGYGIYSKLCFEIKSFPALFIDKIMHREFMGDFLLKSNISTELASFFIGIKEFKNFSPSWNFEFDCSTTFHKVEDYSYIYKPHTHADCLSSAIFNINMEASLNSSHE